MNESQGDTDHHESVRKELKRNQADSCELYHTIIAYKIHY